MKDKEIKEKTQKEINKENELNFYWGIYEFFFGITVFSFGVYYLFLSRKEGFPVEFFS